MNKKILTIIFCLIATVVCLLYSCTADSSTEETHMFEETLHAESSQDMQPTKETEKEIQIPGKTKIVINGEAPEEDEYEPEINDGY